MTICKVVERPNGEVELKHPLEGIDVVTGLIFTLKYHPEHATKIIDGIKGENQ